ncbi:MAG: complex I subunit 5 family protein [Sulfolobales archaeon]
MILILLSTILIPLIATFFIALNPSIKGDTASKISFASLLYSLVVYIILAILMKMPYYEKLYTIPMVGSIAFILDGYNLPFLVGISLVTSLVSLYSYPYMSHRFHELERGSWRTYFVNYNLFSVSMLGVALSTNLIEFYIFLEISLITSFFLIALYGYGERIRIGIMYFIWTHAGALLFLIASFIYGLNANTFDFISPNPPYYMPGFGERILGGLAFYVFLFFLVGLLIKLPAFGFHIWLPYAHAEAPTPVSALLSPNLIGLAALGILRILIVLFPSTYHVYQLLIIFWAFISIIYGGLMALFQRDYKRLLAYSSISQMGYILLGLSTLNPAGLIGAVLHYLTHAVGKASLFMTAGNIIVQGKGLRDIERMGGLASSMNFTAGSALLGFLSISGLPPTIGVISKFFIIAGLVEYMISISSYAPLLVALILMSLIGFGLTLVYSFHTMRRIFYGTSKGGIEISEASPSASYTTFSIALSSIVLMIMIFIFTNPLYSAYHTISFLTSLR